MLPARLAPPASLCGSSGETAAALPTEVQFENVAFGLAQSRPAAAITFGSRLLGIVMSTPELGDSVACWVIAVRTAAPSSFASFATTALSCGAYASDEQPLTCRGALAVLLVVGADCESAATVTFAGVVGQLAGIRIPLNVRFSSDTAGAAGRLANLMFRPTPAGSLAGRTEISRSRP